MEILLSELDNFSALYEQGHVGEAYRRNCIHCLRRLSLKFSRLPPSYFRHDAVTKSQHITGGAFADIYKGSLNGTPVCIKVCASTQVKQKMGVAPWSRENFCREALSWGLFHHPNILSFLGVYEDPPSFWLISPWMENGSLLDFLEKHPGFDRLKAIINTAEGMRYLHEHDSPIFHANIRGVNILVTSDHRICLADFGLSALTEMTVSSARKGGTGAWMAPEIIRGIPEGTPPSPKRDIFVFGSTMFE
ncbi:kinase-like domain-containing protein, partial [Mycena vulgaris]